LVSDGDTVPRGFESTETVYPAGSIYLATDKGERRRSGSYYTPDHIVDHIVQKAVGEKCAEVFERLEYEIEDLSYEIAKANPADKALLEQLEDLKGSFDDRILELKILDPAMGSGHFLIRACQYLAEEIATNPYTADPDADDLAEDESTITFWKRRVAENCLFGVDVNPMAVELAKLAVWLETVASDAPLTFLDHHLRCGDTIIGSRISQLDTLPRDKGLFEGHFSEEVEAALPKLLGPLQEIHSIPSNSVENVKRKEQIFRRRFTPVNKRFALVADLWSAEAMAEGSFLAEQYSDLVSDLNTQKRFARKIGRSWVLTVLADIAEREVRPFHWELGFPEAFLQSGTSGSPGFDVIIGNPPYDVLSEREIGRSIDHFKNFISVDKTLSASQVGKNNLYKLFICRSLSLLRDDGIFSFIVPMGLLGDEQTRDIRRLLIDAGDFREIHAFPQKDNPNRRVFKDAKLSTTFFVYRHQKERSGVRESFVSSVHPGSDIDQSSPKLTLDANSITLYDPSNVTIVSCAQSDWDLVISIDESRVARLGRFVEYFQGEVNQTVASRRGHLTTENAGPFVTRGACISLYKLRDASQGEDIYLNVDAFLNGKKKDSKAFHHEFERVGLQESSAQNNFRRIISCRIPAGNFCNHKINYTTVKHSAIPLELVLFVQNSLFADWYFRLGSTNAAVSHYQLKNIPCPSFGQKSDPLDAAFERELEEQISNSSWDALEHDLLRRAKTDGSSQTIETCIKKLVRYIELEEDNRGEISRTERSSLSTNGALAQRVLDKLYLVLIGVNEDKAEYLRSRLNEML